MANVELIIEFLDTYLTENSLNEIGAVEANELLDENGLLRDNPHRLGLPLRNLLREGKIPHAYQTGFKYSEWIIPHSSKGPARKSNYQGGGNATNDNRIISLKSGSGLSKKGELEEQIYKARIKYKPEKIKVLLIAEAPPDSIERFFYYEDVKTADYLFLGIMEVLSPESKREYMQRGRDPQLKRHLLNWLKEEGFYLSDLSNLPLSYLSHEIERQIPALLEKLSNIITKETPIILLKVSIFNLLYTPLEKAGYTSVVPIEIPFPSTGHQQEFYSKFKEAIELIS